MTYADALTEYAFHYIEFSPREHYGVDVGHATRFSFPTRRFLCRRRAIAFKIAGTFTSYFSQAGPASRA